MDWELKPFNLERAINGSPVCFDGCPDEQYTIFDLCVLNSGTVLRFKSLWGARIVKTDTKGVEREGKYSLYMPERKPGPPKGLKPWNLEEVLKGAKAAYPGVTHSYMIHDVYLEKKILGMKVLPEGKLPSVLDVTLTGELCAAGIQLYMIPEPEEKTVYVNIYNDGQAGINSNVYLSEEQAKGFNGPRVVAKAIPIKIKI